MRSSGGCKFSASGIDSLTDLGMLVFWHLGLVGFRDSVLQEIMDGLVGIEESIKIRL